MTTVAFDFAALTDPGGRKVNEDSILCMTDKTAFTAQPEPSTQPLQPENLALQSSEGPALFAVADGLGGHGYGEVASRIAIESTRAAFARDNSDLDACFLDGQQKILEEQERAHNIHGFKTTLVALSILDGSARWGHIGDSRLYCFKNGKLALRTIDHSVPQMLVSIGEIKEKEIRHHPDRNRLLRSMGTEWATPRYQLSEAMPLTGGEAFLLCSDGFWEWLDEKLMTRLYNHAKDVSDWLTQLAQAAASDSAKKPDSKRDNYSAIAIWIKNVS